MAPSLTLSRRTVSMALLFGMILGVGYFFFRVVQPFLLALFIAVIMAVLFSRPHAWITQRIGNRPRIAAAITTALVVFLVLVPIAITLTLAGGQLMQSGKSVVAWLEKPPPETLDETLDEIDQSRIGAALASAYDKLPEAHRERVRTMTSQIANNITADLHEKTTAFISDALAFIIGFSIMALALYYFLADKAAFLEEVHRLTPLKRGEERQLTEEFHLVCRGVVLGTVLAGVVQAALSGVAYAVLGVPQLWLLIVLTMFGSFIPFLGSAAIWAPVCGYLAFQDRWPSAIGLAIYGAVVIASADNLVRAYVIGNQAKLHPLVALVTVLGAIKLIGLWGIFVGPMIASFLYALINIGRQRFLNETEQSTT